MYVVAFVAGTFTAFFDIAYQAYLPVLVKRSELLDANSKLETSRASSQVAGPSIAGLAVSAIGNHWKLHIVPWLSHLPITSQGEGTGCKG